jgi:hypothetical protein
MSPGFEAAAVVVSLPPAQAPPSMLTRVVIAPTSIRCVRGTAPRGSRSDAEQHRACGPTPGAGSRKASRPRPADAPELSRRPAATARPGTRQDSRRRPCGSSSILAPLGLGWRRSQSRCGMRRAWSGHTRARGTPEGRARRGRSSEAQAGRRRPAGRPGRRRGHESSESAVTALRPAASKRALPSCAPPSA